MNRKLLEIHEEYKKHNPSPEVSVLSGNAYVTIYLCSCGKLYTSYRCIRGEEPSALEEPTRRGMMRDWHDAIENALKKSPRLYKAWRAVPAYGPFKCANNF